MYTIREDTIIRVHLIKDPGEAEFYSDLLTRRHYLESSAYRRNQIVHVARQGRQDVAILTWDAGTRHRFGKRDRLIGWTPEQKAKRGCYCVENRRFLMLTEGVPNLASHILAKSVERLSGDAQAVWGHDVLLAETFVDTSRSLEGTCYKAAGWTDVGLTAGGHGKEQWSRKHYFVKELKADALAKLKAPALSPSDTTNPRQRVLYLEQLDVAGLKSRLEKVPDFRSYAGKYKLVPTLALIIAAVLCGAKDAKAVHRWISALAQDFLKSLGFRQAPSYSTIWRVITGVNSEALQGALVAWLKQQVGKTYVAEGVKQFCLDGKALRAASKANGSKLHVVTMIEAVSRTVLDQRMTDAKSNEIPKVQEILQDAPIDANVVVTTDALNTQYKTADIIQKKNGSYLFTVKDNQLNLTKAILEETPEEQWSQPYSTTTYEHGRIERRTVQLAQLQVGELDFPGARTIAKVTRQREQKRTGKVSKPETVACISNLVNPTPEEFGRLLQRHWNVEALFHVRDATMLEDRHTMHTGQGPMNFSMLRNVAVSLKHLTGERSVPDSTARFQQNIYAFLAPFQVDPLALAENPLSLAA